MTVPLIHIYFLNSIALGARSENLPASDLPTNLEFTNLDKEKDAPVPQASTSTTSSRSTRSTLQSMQGTAAAASEKTAGGSTQVTPTAGGSTKVTATAAKVSPPITIPLRATANSSLLRIVNALPDGERKKEIARLNALSEMEFEWANSDATMKALDGALPPRPRPKPKPKPVPRAKDASSSQPSRSPSPVPSSGSEPVSAQEDVNALPDGVPDVSTSPSTDSAPVTLSSSRADNAHPTSRPPTDIPEWIEEHRDRLNESPMAEALQVTWNRVIRNWILLEEAQGYQVPQKGFPVPGRPREVSLWIQNARSGNIVVTPERNDGFTKDFLAWWDKINPEWRAREDGRLVVDGSGTWDELFRPGKCGFLLVLECIRALYVTADIEVLTYALGDVDWALNECLLALARRYATILLVLLYCLLIHTY